MTRPRRILLPALWDLGEGEPMEAPRELAHYLVRVLRLGDGATVTVFDGRGGEMEARLAVRGPMVLLERAGGPRRGVSTEARRVHLLMALLKGQAMDDVVREATELGCARITPVRCERSVAVPEGSRAEARVGRWRRISEAAARQCGRADVPVIDPITPLTRAIVGLARGGGARILAHPGAGQGLSRDITQGHRDVTVLVGPEGGLTGMELREAGAAGFVAVDLGPRILRARTAAPVMVALVQYVIGDLGPDGAEG